MAIDAEPALFGAGLLRGQLSRDDIGLSVASQYRFLELAATEANDQLLGLQCPGERESPLRRRDEQPFVDERSFAPFDPQSMA
jgi:hypothetical protein